MPLQLLLELPKVSLRYAPVLTSCVLGLRLVRLAHRLIGAAAGSSPRVRTAFPDWDDPGRVAEPARDRGFVAAANRYLQIVG